MYCGMSPSRFCRAAGLAGFPPVGVVAPHSSVYWTHRSLSTISAHAANLRRSASPLVSLPELVFSCALASAINNSLAGSNVAPTTPSPLRKERRPTMLGAFEVPGSVPRTGDWVWELAVGG